MLVRIDIPVHRQTILKLIVNTFVVFGLPFLCVRSKTEAPHVAWVLQSHGLLKMKHLVARDA